MNNCNTQENLPALQRRLTDTLDEYETKLAAIPQAVADFEAAGETAKLAATVAGVWEKRP